MSSLLGLRQKAATLTTWESLSSTDRIVVNRILQNCTEDAVGCFLWTKARNPDGYGVIRVGSLDDHSRRTAYIHRLMYSLAVGPVPEGMEVSHSCRNFHCANPEHFVLMTHQEVVMSGGAPRFQLDKTHCPRGHEYSERNTYRYPDGRRACRICRRTQK